MSVRFIVGRAGSGKTHRCLEAIRARLRQDAARGNRLLLIVPEQASFQMERALIETPDIAAFTCCEVLSFQRLAHRIFAETGADPRRADTTIGGFGRMMVIRRLIAQEQPALRLLNSVADKPGLIAQVSRTFDELMREEVEPAGLAEVAAQLEPRDPLAAAKLADVARLYQAYMDYLVGDRIDPAQSMQLAAERLDGIGWLSAAEVWVDGFAGFTRQEFHLLAELARRVSAVEVTMLVSPDASAVTASEVPDLSFSLFARAERTLVRLRTELQARGVEVGEPIRLSVEPGASRFAHEPLRRLEAALFEGDICASHEEVPAASPQIVRVLEFADRRAEVEAAVAEVQRLTGAGGERREEGGQDACTPMRYREIAVVVRDLAAYHDLLSAAMRSRQIPCFIDRREPTTHHPLIELLRGLLAMANDDCRLDSVRLVLKTGLLPFDAVEADLLENYLLAHGIEGRSRWQTRWEYTRFFSRREENNALSARQQAVLDRVNELRERWLDLLGDWLAVADRGEVDGRMWATSLFVCLQRMHAGERLEAWAQAAVQDGEPQVADMHRQVWLDFTELLDEFVRALGGESMRIASFRETLEAGLGEFSLGLAPPALDTVLVGAVERSRQPDIRAVLLLGFDEAHYPMRRSEDPLLGDAEREALRRANAEIGPSRKAKLTDERMLAYIALTRASERLWISYPRLEADGKPLQPSAYLRELLDALPGVAVEHVPDAEAGRSAGWMSHIRQLGSRLAREFRYRPKLAEETDAVARGHWNAIYEAARAQALSRDDWRYTLARGLSGLGYTNVAGLAPGLIERAVAQPFAASVSRLESMAACPFKHCAEYLLRLEQRVEAQTNQVDLGKVCHLILEKLIEALAAKGQRLADLTDDEIIAQVDGISDEVLPGIAADLMLEDARSEFLLDRNRGQLSRVMRWQRNFARAGRFRPVAAEFPFGYASKPDAVVRLRTPKGRDILLRGKIDRVDVAELGQELVGLVMDYKRAKDRRLNLCEVYHGLALQLVGYMLAMMQVGRSLAGREIRPVAALYLPLLEPYKSVGHPEDDKSESYKCRGIVDGTALEVIDDSVAANGPASQYVAAKLTKDGRPHASCDLTARGELSAVIAHVQRRMGELADSILDGEVGIRPYRLNRTTPCGFCVYKAVCRYEIETQPPRKLEGMRRRDALDAMTQGGEA